VAEIAAEINSVAENIGARRLYTVMEKLLEDVSSMRRRARRGSPGDRGVGPRNPGAAGGDRDLARYIL